MNDHDALATAARLQAMGVAVRSAELQETANKLVEFRQNGNRAMRRAAKRAQRRRGR